MDDNIFLLLSEVDLIAEDDENDYRTAMTCAIIIAHGVLEAHHLHVDSFLFHIVEQKSSTHSQIESQSILLYNYTAANAAMHS